MKIHQDALISRIDLVKGETFDYQLKSNNHGVYVMTIYGKTLINENSLKTRDAIGVSDTKSFKIETNEDSGLLFIEVPLI